MWRLKLLIAEHGWRIVLLGGVLLIFAEIVLFGGVKASTGLIFAALFAVWSSLAVIALPGPGPFLRHPGLAIAALGSVLLCAWGLITLTSWIPAWSAPVWEAAGAEPAITYDRAATQRETVKLAALGALFVAGLTIGRQRRQTRFFLRLLASAAAVFGIWSAVTFLIDPELLLGAPKRFHIDRLTGSFFSANTAGSLFGAFAALFAVLAAEEGVNQARRTPEFGVSTAKGPSATLVLFCFAAVVCLGALLFTGSRFAIAATALGVGAGAFLITILAGVRKWIAGVIGLVALGAAVALPILSNAGAARRAGNIDQTTLDRLRAIGRVFEVAQERFWQGHGLGAFREALAPAVDAKSLPILWDLGAAHNLAAQWLIEGGVIGAGLAAVVLLGVLSTLWPWPLTRSRPGRGRAIAVLAFALVLLAHNLVDYSLQVPAVASLFALLLGLGAAPALQGEHKGEAA